MKKRLDSDLLLGSILERKKKVFAKKDASILPMNNVLFRPIQKSESKCAQPKKVKANSKHSVSMNYDEASKTVEVVRFQRKHALMSLLSQLVDLYS